MDKRKTNQLQQTAGMLGMGAVGAATAKAIESRGHIVVPYDTDEKKGFVKNLEAVRECEIVFVAVPTPVFPNGEYNLSTLRAALGSLRAGQVAVIKSTILPETTALLQNEFPRVRVLNAPEFLEQNHAERDALNPWIQIVGIPKDADEYRAVAQKIFALMPDPENGKKFVWSSPDAALFKLQHNFWRTVEIVLQNQFYNAWRAVCPGNGSHDAWEKTQDAHLLDRRFGQDLLRVMHEGGRGAGGHCLPKDARAYVAWCQKNNTGDELGNTMVAAIEAFNSSLLVNSGKK